MLTGSLVNAAGSGRGLNPFSDVLESLARALRLSEDERAYLFALAGQRPTDRGSVPEVPPHPPTAQLVHDLSPLPAMLLDHRLDLLAWNREMSALLLDLDTQLGLTPGHDRRFGASCCQICPDLRPTGDHRVGGLWGRRTARAGDGPRAGFDYRTLPSRAT